MTQAIQPYQPTSQLNRSGQKAVSVMRGQHELNLIRNDHERQIVTHRLEAGAVMSGGLNFWLENLGQQQVRLQTADPDSAGRVGHVLDQLALNGAQTIGRYMRGQL